MLDKWAEVGQSIATLVVGLAWAGGAYASAPLLNAIPTMIHTLLGWGIAVLGGIGIVTKLMKK